MKTITQHEYDALRSVYKIEIVCANGIKATVREVRIFPDSSTARIGIATRYPNGVIAVTYKSREEFHTHDTEKEAWTWYRGVCKARMEEHMREAKQWEEQMAKAGRMIEDPPTDAIEV